MNALIIPGGRNTPSIWLEPAAERFEIAGVSSPENASEFYQPIFDWLTIHLPRLEERPVFHFRLSYFNSTSLKAIFQMLKLLKEAATMGPQPIVRWYVEEDDEFMTESAEMFTQLLDMKFEIVNVPQVDPGARAAG